MKVFLTVVAALVAAVAANSAYPKPAYPSYSKSYDYAPMPYVFAWGVKDDYTYNNYAHQESSDDKGYVSGSYRTLLPDGRTQTVNYKADDYTGYVAEVKYDREAKYNDYKPTAYKPAGYYTAPAYKADYPAYKPTYSAPAYPKY
ncbi:hypothetical protein OUZ56_022209 [Daphnia magna]|nr:hypothetical protein OUZ56_022209 [Daphnia magna]